MSLILDALKKAERDNRGDLPDLSTYHVPTYHQAALWQQPWVVISLGIIILLLTVLVTILFVKKTTAPEIPALTSTTVNTPSQTLTTSGTVPTAINPTGAPINIVIQTAPNQPYPTISGDANLNYLSQDMTQPSQDPSLPRRGVIPSEALSQTDTDLLTSDTHDLSNQAVFAEVPDSISETNASNPQKRPSSVDEQLAKELWNNSKIQPVPAELLAKIKASTTASSAFTEPPKAEIIDPAIANAAVSETLAAFKDHPFLHQLPITHQNKIPTLMYAKHVYAEGRVVINKKELRAGDVIDGVTLERVLADGVLLNYKGAAFKLSTLSSWVNY